MNNEIRQALVDLEQAEQNFKNADKAFTDVAIFQLNAANAKLNLLIKEMKNDDNLQTLLKQ